MLRPWRGARRPTLHERLAALRAERERREADERAALYDALMRVAHEAQDAGEERKAGVLVHGCEIILRPVRR